MSDAPHEPETTVVDTAPDVEPDVQSDPALDDAATGDWSEEGGATSSGPATATDDE